MKTQRLSVEARPSANGYFQLADFAYRAGQVEAGDRAAKEAVRRTPSDQRNTVRSLIKDTKKQGAEFAKALEEAKKAERQQQKAGGEARRARPELRPPARDRRDGAAAPRRSGEARPAPLPIIAARKLT